MLEVRTISRILKQGLTEKEREIMDTIVKTGSLNSACVKLGISESTGAQRLYRLRQRYDRAKLFIAEYNRYKNRIADAGIGLYL